MGVIDRLKKYILVDGFHVVVDLKKSKGSWIVDAETGKRYLDCYSQFASQALGWNYKPFKDADKTRLKRIVDFKLANSDMYSEVYADFVETFANICPDFYHFFFIEGGSCGVENALKAAFDWKCQVSPEWQIDDGNRLDVIHLKEAFHGRTGYALSLTNTGSEGRADRPSIKTKWYPKFPWTRVTNPKMSWNHNPVDNIDVLENQALAEMEIALRRGNVAAIIFETIQGEGGDNHFRNRFFKAVRHLADRYQAMLILDEIQCGMGLTGQWWAYQHTDVKPDMICFGKKAQVCGFACNTRIDHATDHVFKQSGRINSTWGGNFVDMERSRLIIEIIKEQKLIENAADVGDYFFELLSCLPAGRVSRVRGSGLMLAFDLAFESERNLVVSKLHDQGLLALKSGSTSIRFRPALTFSKDDVDEAMNIIRKVLS